MSETLSHDRPTPVIYSRRIPVRMIGANFLLATTTVPQAIVSDWKIRQTTGRIDYRQFLGIPLEYAIYQASPNDDHEPDVRYKVSKDGQVSLPKRLFKDRRVPYESIEARVVRYGQIAVISALGDMLERARLVPEGASEMVGHYPAIVPREQLDGIVSEIQTAPREVSLATVALTPLYLEAMFPGINQPTE